MDEVKNQYYYIKEIAELTGLSEQLIRKWESRYHIVQPKRLDNGYRVYTSNDLLTLKDLKELRDEGKSIKTALQILLAKRKNTKIEKQLYHVEKSPYVEKMIERGSLYDEEGLMFLLKQSNHQYGLELFLHNTVQPFLKEVGDLWEKSEWDESKEVLSSLVVKDYLAQLDRNFNNDLKAPHALGFCLPGERHDIPLQILILCLKMRGWRTTRIGASPKFSSFEKLIKHIQPQKVLFSATTMIPFQQNENLLEMLERIAEKYSHISFYIGGRGVWDYTEVVKPKNLIIAYTVDDILK
ncbi:MAG: MerR family transcriptional regulator [Bacillus sp. (in: firmicutes)]